MPLVDMIREEGGPTAELAENVARAIHEEDHPGHVWDHDKHYDQWLAIGSWRCAKAVMAILPLDVKVKHGRAPR